MTKDELLGKLAILATITDYEMAHVEADDALLAYINDAAITEAFNTIEMYYA